MIYRNLFQVPTVQNAFVYVILYNNVYIILVRGRRIFSGICLVHFLASVSSSFYPDAVPSRCWHTYRLVCSDYPSCTVCLLQYVLTTDSQWRTRSLFFRLDPLTRNLFCLLPRWSQPSIHTAHYRDRCVGSSVFDFLSR